MKLAIEIRNRSLSYLIFPILIFLPKIDVISVSGYWQGIRIEDILILIYFISLISSKVPLINLNQKNIFFPGLLIFVYIFISNSISLINGNDPKILMIIRLAEYVMLFFMIKNLTLDKQKIVRLFYLYIILNLIVTILQSNEIIGSISSRGYLSSSHALNDRTYGIAGGSWELGILLTLSFFIILKNTNNLVRDYLLFIPIIYLQIFMSYSKTSIIGFGFIILIILPRIIKNINNSYQRILFGYFILLISATILMIFSEGNVVFHKYLALIKNFNFSNFKEIMYNFIFYIKIPEITEVDKSLYSLWHRLHTWQDILNIYISNEYNILFGTGFVKYLYLESNFLRILTSLGIIGTLIIMISITRFNLYHLIFLFIISFSFDFFVSFKIFLFFLILCKDFLNPPIIHKIK